MRPWNRPEASGPTLQVPLKPRAGPDPPASGASSEAPRVDVGRPGRLLGKPGCAPRLRGRVPCRTGRKGAGLGPQFPFS